MASPLPNEMLAAVFENLQPKALVQIVRVSRRFRAVAERILYTNVAILEELPRSSPMPHHTVTFCETVLRRAHLQEAVKKLSIRWMTEGGPREPYMAAIEPVLAVLNRALRTLHHLESLELALGMSGGSLSSRGILSGCAFPALRLFALSGVGRGALPAKTHPAAPPAPIEWFLAATPSIQHLRLGDCHEVLQLAPGDLPQLRAFRGSAPTAASVLPGRPVQLLGLVGHEFVTARDLARIAASSARIRWLDLSAMSVTPLLLRDISRHLSGVECLKVRLALRHTLHHALSGIVSPRCPLRASAAGGDRLRRVPPVYCVEPPRRPHVGPWRISGVAPARPFADGPRRRRHLQRGRRTHPLQLLVRRLPDAAPDHLPLGDGVAAQSRPAVGARRCSPMTQVSTRLRRRPNYSTLNEDISAPYALRSLLFTRLMPAATAIWQLSPRILERPTTMARLCISIV